ncbi:magnesium and cobalt transporter [Candidatus Arthromitus sp. SFB-mouse-Japan]|uniref:magnesium transporter CorA family protein n=1 Tax=Candidatus Arthromitus sp. SFB-mouse TaxID=49118 RepID=UPI00021B816E|nr:magnesium transporter CorA family protein [Candidatus Arthromitus sp. SFB-mouse]EIA21679.1 Magnesium and cobalt transporter [Candidatus Arthromitus sp. SFB-1]EIA22607.1 Magnesium and cobalt transporter [Candidatus Arthromitus sp. SFB-3]EIA24933.1 Magnesium and cobalt transporter [Candidatus Arthromitus sp. SFB-2]EIA26656.1 Magnesium and cobalt transporter [Candidatus Arthromitus sp. SFB-4]EIA29388.1 Magnesium and cobalt transporter [Candidatus Arthromitus sp. SFB-co]EIA29483.1 Magnesium an
MICIYKTSNNILERIDNIESGCWINIVQPSEQELLFISKKTDISLDLLNAALDEEETSRIDVELSNILIIVDVPFTSIEENSLTYGTYPLGIISNDNYIVTISIKKNKVISDFIDGKIKNFYTNKRPRFTLQILNKITTYFLLYLRQIDKKSQLIHNKIHKSMKNKELIQLLSLEKSLVYFSTSLKSNEMTLEKLLKYDFIQKYEEDKHLLEDVIIDNKQAIEMAHIYASVLSSLLEFFAALISNNLNMVMKFLASMTIVISVPSIIFTMWGSNVPLPFANNPFGFLILLLIALLLSSIIAIILYKKGMF